MAEERVLFKKNISDLQQITQRNWGSIEGLETIVAELLFRKTETANELKIKIQNRIISLREEQMKQKSTKIISFINLKGGVGKTTLSINIAATLAKSKKKVLVIDLDPQTNATVCLISQQEWQDKQNKKQTLYHLFNEKLESPPQKDFSIEKAVISSVGDIKGLDLLPSSLHLVEIQDLIPDLAQKAYINPIDVLNEAVKPVLSNYDYIIIDCPPNLGTLTLNGINISDYYVIPTIPDILSKIGISLINNRIKTFKSKRDTCKIELLGIIFTKVDYRTNLHTSTMTELRKGENKSVVFAKEFPQRISVAEAPIDNKPFFTSPTAKSKRDWSEVQNLIEEITKELTKRVEG